MAKISLFLFFLTGISAQFFLVNRSQASSSGLVINEIMIGQSGATKNEFVELYNPTDSEIDLTSYSLKKKTKSGAESNLVSSAKFIGVIPAQGYFLISHPDYQATISADLIYSGTSSSFAIASNNTVLLYDQNDILIDKVGFGLASEFENQPMADFIDGQSIERQLGVDTDNNLLDFKINQIPSPQKSDKQALSDDQENKTVFSPSNLVINEFVSDPVSGEKEWIEIYNNLGQLVNLDNWTIEDGVGKILSLQENLDSHGLIIFEISSSKLNNSGDIIILKDPSGNIIDQVVYGNWDDGNIDDNVMKADDSSSVARLVDGVDTDNDKVDFFIATNTTKGISNLKNDQSVLKNNNTDNKKPVSIVGSVVINELVSDPADGPEWIELYNKTDKNIDLTDWSLIDGSESSTKLEGILGGYSYLVIESPKGNLNNSGDTVILLDYYRSVIDQVVYGDWDDGIINDNAPKTVDPKSLARIGSSQDTNNDLTDFQIADIVTKGVANILIKEEIEEQSSLAGKIIISEIFPNPIGSDEGEFIELKNISENKIDLSGLMIGDDSKRKYIIKNNDNSSIWINSKEYFVIKKNQSQIALNNSGGDKVVLFDRTENIIDQVGYKQVVVDNQSYSLIDNTWQWSDKSTAGSDNFLLNKNRPPVIVVEMFKSEVLIGEEIVLDSSDSYDPEGSDLIIEWKIDGKLYHNTLIKLVFGKSGNYEIELIIGDGENISTKQLLINVLDDQKIKLKTESQLSKFLINEFVPNPVGSDEAEFIELFNNSEDLVDLSQFFLDDAQGGNRPYQLPESTILKPKEYLVFNKEKTGLSLNNDNDSVRLLDIEKNIIEQVDYFDPIEGASFSKSVDNDWLWTDIITKGEENQIDFIYQEELTSTLLADKNGVFEVDLNKIREMDIGEPIYARGMVSVEPGILGSQIFYLTANFVEEENIIPSGIQIYNYKKDFPELKAGDEIRVSGVISQSRGEYRIKTKTKNDIEILDHYDLAPLDIKIGDIGELLENVLVKIEGEIIEIKGSTVFLDDGSGEIKVYLKKTTGIKKTDLNEGDMVNISGIISKTADEYMLLPRYQNDINVVKVLGVEMPTTERIDNGKIIIESRNNDWLKYLTVTLGALVFVLGIVVFRVYKK